MGASAFRKGCRIEIEGRAATLARRLDDGIWLVEDVLTGHIAQHDHADLWGLYEKGLLRFISDQASVVGQRSIPLPECVPEQQMRIAKHRRLYVKAALEASTDAMLRIAIHQTWDETRRNADNHRAKGGREEEILVLDRPPDRATVLRWKRRFIDAGGNFLALLDNSKAKGNRTPRLPKKVVELVEEAIENVYLQRTRGTVADAADHAIALVNRENRLRNAADQLPQPSRRHVQSMINAIPAFDRYAAREGRDAAEKRFRGAIQQRITKAPLERVEVDHSPFDNMVIDDESELPLGRPYLTVGIDDYTRCVLGIYVSFEPPSFFTVARWLKHALLPKSDLKERYPSIENPWLAHGVMRELVMDNGPEFHGASLENACYSLNIEPHYTPRKKPWFKPKVERYVKTIVHGTTHGTPGTTFSNIFDKGDYDPVRQAVIRLSVFKEIVHKWVADVYHQRVHRVLGAPPAAAWARSVSADEILVPDDPQRLDLILGHSETRELTHRGIELYGLNYNSPELIALRRRLGEALTVEVRVDKSDLGRIYVIAPDGQQFFKVASLQSDYANGLSAWQHRVITRYARHQLKSYDANGWREAKLQISEIVAAEVLNKKKKRRPTASKAIARYKNFDACGDAQPLAPAAGACTPLAQTGRVVPLTVVRLPPAGVQPVQADASPQSLTPLPVPASATPVPVIDPAPHDARADGPSAPRTRRLKPVIRARVTRSIDDSIQSASDTAHE